MDFGVMTPSLPSLQSSTSLDVPVFVQTAFKLQQLCKQEHCSGRITYQHRRTRAPANHWGMQQPKYLSGHKLTIGHFCSVNGNTAMY